MSVKIWILSLAALLTISSASCSTYADNVSSTSYNAQGTSQSGDPSDGTAQQLIDYQAQLSEIAENPHEPYNVRLCAEFTDPATKWTCQFNEKTESIRLQVACFSTAEDSHIKVRIYRQDSDQSLLLNCDLSSNVHPSIMSVDESQLSDDVDRYEPFSIEVTKYGSPSQYQIVVFTYDAK